MANHEIELDRVPSALKYRLGGLKKLLSANRLIDNLSHSFGCCLWSQCKATTLGVAFQQVHQLRRKGFDPERRQSNIQVPITESFADGLNQVVNLVVVRGGQ